MSTDIEALRQENELMRELLGRWVYGADRISVHLGHWPESDLYGCDWCGGDGDSPDSIEHAPSCLAGL